MTTSSVTCSYGVLRVVGGVVLGPAWSEHLSRGLLAELYAAEVAAPDSPEGDECPSDVDVAARVFFEVLDQAAASVRWPLFAGHSSRQSLFKASVLAVRNSTELTSLARLSDESALAAANIARWLLRKPQQTSYVVVFTTPPRVVSPRSRSRAPSDPPVALVS